MLFCVEFLIEEARQVSNKILFFSYSYLSRPLCIKGLEGYLLLILFKLLLVFISHVLLTHLYLLALAAPKRLEDVSPKSGSGR